MTDTNDLSDIDTNTRILISQVAIEQRVDELRAMLKCRLSTVSAPVTLLVLGRGGHMFAQRLIYGLFEPYTVEYMYPSTYGSGEQVGEFRVRFETAENYEGQHIVVVDDIYDTGTTPHNVSHICRERGAVAVESIFLLSKPSRRKYDIPVVGVGLEIPDVFVYGYGMDAYGFDALRRLTSVCCLRENFPKEGAPFSLPS